MSPFRYRDDESSTGTIVGVLVGALAGFAAGMFVAQRVGGFGGLTSKIRKRAGGRFAFGRAPDLEDEELDEYEEDELEPEEYDESLETRVLEAFRNDPILCERAIDIGSIGDGIIELAGWVESDDEAEHAVTFARGVPDVDTVVNRMREGGRSVADRDGLGGPERWYWSPPPGDVAGSRSACDAEGGARGPVDEHGRRATRRGRRHRRARRAAPRRSQT